MNAMPGVLLALAIFVTFCDAQCTLTTFKTSENILLTGCRDTRDEFHEFGTDWEYDCLHCNCLSRIGLYCCSVIKRPKGYDRRNCKKVFRKDACMYVPVKKADPSKECKVERYTG